MRAPPLRQAARRPMQACLYIMVIPPPNTHPQACVADPAPPTPRMCHKSGPSAPSTPRTATSDPPHLHMGMGDGLPEPSRNAPNWPIGAASCRQQYDQASYQTPLPQALRWSGNGGE